MTTPDFLEMAREWLVRAQGHARVEHEKSLADEMRKAWELGIAQAIEALGSDQDHPDRRWPLEEAEARIRVLTDKPSDPTGN